MNELFKIIKKKIEENNGWITFEKFMEICLYESNIGYYEKYEHSPGKTGDYITSVNVGPLFGYLLAFRIKTWLYEIIDKQKNTDEIYIMEAGADKGVLASDILKWFQTYDRMIFDRLKYVILEPSDVRKGWQKNTLISFSDKILWYNSSEEAFQSIRNRRRGDNGINAVILSNELLDSFPIHKLSWDAEGGRWLELCVSTDDNKLKFVKVAPSQNCIEYLNKIDRDVLDTIPDGFVLEIPIKAINWWANAASHLNCGKLLTIDYGYISQDLVNPLFPKGTFRGYKSHHICDDVLNNIGDMDLTADVNFSLIIKTGEKAGLKTEFFGNQEEFLVSIVKEFSTAELPYWFTKNLHQFKTLTHPNHLGRQMKALVQSTY